MERGAEDPKAHPAAWGHAVVVGASMAGLLAARVLADEFEQVTLIDRDRLPGRPELRKGVPQAHHAHVLLLRGAQILEELCPGVLQEMRDAGAVPVNMGEQAAWYVRGQRRPVFTSSIELSMCSRPLVEETFRRRVAAHPRVRAVEDAEVVGLRVEGGGAGPRAAGVRLRDGREIAADLVVDASGRASHAPAWLEALGLPRPERTTLDPQAAYASRTYRAPEDPARWWRAVYVQPAPPSLARGGIVQPMEGGTWLVTLIGLSGEVPPTDEEGFLAYAKSLCVPIVHEAVRSGEPLGPIHGIRRFENVWNHYERLERRLARFLVIGDACTVFNPVYGQGMTAAALSAVALRACLEEGRARPDDWAALTARAQARIAEAAQVPWQMATGEDRRWPNARGAPPADPAAAQLARYMDQVLAASTRSPAVAEAFYRVQSLIDPPALFFRPDIVLEVFGALPAPDAALPVG